MILALAEAVKSSKNAAGQICKVKDGGTASAAVNFMEFRLV